MASLNCGRIGYELVLLPSDAATANSLRPDAAPKLDGPPPMTDAPTPVTDAPPTMADAPATMADAPAPADSAGPTVDSPMAAADRAVIDGPASSAESGAARPDLAAADVAPDRAPDQAPDAAVTCTADPHDYAIAAPLMMVGVGSRAAILRGGASGALWVQPIDPNGTALVPTQVATDNVGGQAMIRGLAPDEVIVTFQAVHNGWRAAQGVSLNLASSAMRTVDYYEGGHHHAWTVPTIRSGVFALVFEDELHPLMAATYYQIRLDRRSDVATLISSKSAMPTFRSVAAVGTSAGYIALESANPDTAVHAFDASGTYLGSRGSLSGDLVRFVIDAARPTVLSSSGGKLDLVELRPDGTINLAPRAIKATAGAAITIASAVETPEGTYVAWIEGTNVHSSLATASTIVPQASRGGVAGGTWLARIGNATYRATDVGSMVTVERLCP